MVRKHGHNAPSFARSVSEPGISRLGPSKDHLVPGFYNIQTCRHTLKQPRQRVKHFLHHLTFVELRDILHRLGDQLNVDQFTATRRSRTRCGGPRSVSRDMRVGSSRLDRCERGAVAEDCETFRKPATVLLARWTSPKVSFCSSSNLRKTATPFVCHHSSHVRPVP